MKTATPRIALIRTDDLISLGRAIDAVMKSLDPKSETAADLRRDRQAVDEEFDRRVVCGRQEWSWSA